MMMMMMLLLGLTGSDTILQRNKLPEGNMIEAILDILTPKKSVTNKTKTINLPAKRTPSHYCTKGLYKDH